MNRNFFRIFICVFVYLIRRNSGYVQNFCAKRCLYRYKNRDYTYDDEREYFRRRSIIAWSAEICASLIDCLPIKVATEGLGLGFWLKFAAEPAPDFSAKFMVASVSISALALVSQTFSFELFKFLLRFSLSSFMHCMISSLFK